MMVIDATNCIAGRLASTAAKALLKGEEIAIINAEKAVVTGNPKHTLEMFTQKVERGDPYHGPFYPRRPDKILRRMVRSMLPYKKPRGRQALKNLRVYVSVPEELEKAEKTNIEDVKKRPGGKFITLERVSEKLGAEKTW
jgi:large subunit ribosomal protein L13